MTPKRKKSLVQRMVHRDAAAATAVSDGIGKLAEPGFEERESARRLADFLSARGFAVEWPWRQMPTAFRATRGKGRPVIGLLAEYDALPDCGPKQGQWGHGCGHNLLGGAAALAAVAVANALDEVGARGTVVLYGCPAEEILGGKVYMARDGAFAGDDAILAWHPAGVNKVCRKGGAALDSIIFEYFGRTAHGTSAHAGRSALDGVMLLDVAANYLREHVPEHVRIHMCICSGGDAPNVVPAYAKCWYYVRGKNRTEVDDVRDRLLAAARGAAMATGTRMKHKRLAGIYERLENDAFSDAMFANLKLFGAPRATKADVAAARRAGIKKPQFNASIETGPGQQGRGSTDEDNVSRLVPLTSLNVACVAKGTTGHHREYAAQTFLPFAHRGMVRAAEVLAATAIDLATDRMLRRTVQAEFRKRRGKFRYDPLVGKRQKPLTVNP